MRLTLFTDGGGARRIAGYLDIHRRALSVGRGRRAVLVSPKAATLLVLLAAGRLDAAARSTMGWVQLAEISELREWVGSRTSASLAAQVRREIKHLHLVVPNAIETPRGAALKGPFRLRMTPDFDGQISEIVASVRLPLARSHGGTSSEGLFSWLEHTEPIWRSLWYYDKPGEAMSNTPMLDSSLASDSMVRSVCHLSSAKRLREMGEYDEARLAIAAALAASAAETNVVMRRYLDASAALQLAWLHYRRGDLDATERAVNAADADATGSALFRLRGQLLNLRSLVRRHQARYQDARDDLESAARLFFVEGDLFHLFAVYHNLACLVAAEAATVADVARQHAMYRRALTFSRRNEAYCKRYGVGHNSVVNKLLQIALLRKLGDASSAARTAVDAERLALETQNFPELFSAHRHRLELLVAHGPLRAAAEVNAATAATLPGRALKRRAARLFREVANASTREARRGQRVAAARRRAAAPTDHRGQGTKAPTGSEPGKRRT